MTKTILSDNCKLSRIVHGYWRLDQWNLTREQLLRLIQESIEIGVTSFDHADIYGDYTCEALFGKALALNKGLRKEMELVTKCGIKLLSDKFPNRKIKHYDYSKEYIISSVENSLAHFGTDYIDLLLLHRPSPFFNAEEVAEAFSSLKKSGKVLHFGVSNFNPLQFEMLESYLDFPIVTNQVEISPMCLEHFDNGNIDFFLKNKIKPMAWSPLAGGRIFKPQTPKEENICKELSQVSEELGVDSIDKMVYAWLLKHPTEILPVVGSRSIDRLKIAVEAQDVDISLEQWLRIYVASSGTELP